MVALEGRWEEKKKKKNCFQMVYIPKRAVEVFFSFFHFHFWFLVFYCRVTRVARGVLFWGGGWAGLGLYTTQGKFALDWTTLQVHVTFSY